MFSILSYLLAATLYGLAGWHFWRTTNTRISGTADHATNSQSAQIILLVPLALHGLILYQSIFVDGLLSFGVGNAISAIVWFAALIYWLSGFLSALKGFQNLMAPVSFIAAAAVLAPLLFPAAHPLAHTELTVFKAHLLAALLAYGFFTIAVLHALLMTALERHLHQSSLSRLFNNLPPLLMMEKMLFRLVWAGFTLLSLTLFSGIFFSQEIFGQSLTFSHKTLFGIISWVIFAALLTGRHFFGWRGRTAIRWTLTGFVILLLAYVGSKFVLEVILAR
ncbi:MAG: cytochrome c biogenesis protein CcsA [Nitrosomonas sp.]|nr:cytochrome c biogenesis protein CcsA [Nitrosomonas sp.]